MKVFESSINSIYKDYESFIKEESNLYKGNVIKQW